MRALTGLVIPLLCAGCVAAAEPEPVIAAVSQDPVTGMPQCRDYTESDIVN